MKQFVILFYLDFLEFLMIIDEKICDSVIWIFGDSWRVFSEDS